MRVGGEPSRDDLAQPVLELSMGIHMSAADRAPALVRAVVAGMEADPDGSDVVEVANWALGGESVAYVSGRQAVG
jgi:hypothetical protein